jgi:hypothetical protein
MHLTDKFILLIQMGADHRKIGRKILDLRDQKMGAGHMILEETTPKPEAVTQVEAKAGPISRQTSLLHVPREKHRSSDKGLSHFSKVQKEDDPKAQPTIDHSNSQRS